MTAGIVISIVSLAASLMVSALIVAYGYGKLASTLEGLDARLRRIEANLILHWEPEHEKR